MLFPQLLSYTVNRGASLPSGHDSLFPFTQFQKLSSVSVFQALLFNRVSEIWAPYLTLSVS